jgi:hypothetical protein
MDLSEIPLQYIDISASNEKEFEKICGKVNLKTEAKKLFNKGLKSIFLKKEKMVQNI